MPKKKLMQIDPVLRRVNELVGRAVKAQADHGPGWLERSNSLHTDIAAFDRSIGKGLKLGRLVIWTVADGKAFYFVTEIEPETCRLIHVPLSGGCQSPVVIGGIAITAEVERAINIQDGLREIFEKMEVAV